MKELGYSETQIAPLNHIQGYYRNSFLVRPHLMIKLIRHMNKAMDIALTNRNVSSDLSKNANYKNGTEVAQRIFQKTYYELWPFVFERLPVFFFHLFEARVHYHDVPCMSFH